MSIKSPKSLIEEVLKEIKTLSPLEALKLFKESIETSTKAISIFEKYENFRVKINLIR